MVEVCVVVVLVDVCDVMVYVFVVGVLVGYGVVCVWCCVCVGGDDVGDVDDVLCVMKIDDDVLKKCLIVVYMDGCFDMMYYGYVNVL